MSVTTSSFAHRVIDSGVGVRDCNMGGTLKVSFGSGSAHNNLQPYITVYMWKRTA